MNVQPVKANNVPIHGEDIQETPVGLAFVHTITFNGEPHSHVLVGKKIDSFTPVKLTPNNHWRALKDGEKADGYLLQRKTVHRVSGGIKTMSIVVHAQHVLATLYE